MATRKSTGKPAGSLTPALITLHRQLQLHLQPTVDMLRLAQAAITTSAVVLREQNADRDGDVARVLLYCAADPLDREIERIEALLDTLGGRNTKDAADQSTH
jgi:hypothetical protein